MSSRTMGGAVVSRLAEGRSVPATAVALVLTLIVTLLTMSSAFIAQPAHAESNAASPPIAGPENIFYAYANAGEGLRVSFTKDPNIEAGIHTTITVQDPTGAERWTCELTAASPTGTACTAPAGLTSTVAGAWKVTATQAAAGTAQSPLNWNIGVFAAGQRQTGRVWSPEYSIFQESRAETADLEYWMVNDSGYVYHVSLSEYLGINSTIRANELGLTTTSNGECIPRYRSGEGNGVTRCGSEYRVFFEAPGATLPARATSPDGTLTVKPAPLTTTDVRIDDLVFTADAPGAVSGELSYSLDERFTGAYVLQIDTNGNGVYGETVDRSILRTADGSGSYSYDYDGLNGLGDPVSSCIAQSARVAIDQLGEIHILQRDVEGRGGISIERLNGPAAGRNTIHWNDNFLTKDRTTTTPLFLTPPAGVDSGVAGGVHGWPFHSTNSWGEGRTIDDWAFVPVDYNSEPVTFGGQCLEIEKSSNRTTATRVGDTVTYTVTATNAGTGDYTEQIRAVFADNLSGVLDDGVYNGDATSSRPGEIVYNEPVLAWGGALPAGESVTLTYTVTLTAELAKTGDGKVRNVAWVPPGPPADPNDPGEPPVCDPPVGGKDPATGLSCAEVEYDLPRLRIAKSADKTQLPASGGEVTYTVTVRNPSNAAYTAAAPASFRDDLAEVLDDATLVEGSITASAGQASFSGETLSWSGPIAPGGSVTVTYTVRYTAAGDNVLTNVACLPADEVRAPDRACDENRIPGAALARWKTATPSSTPLVAGSTIDYTLHFENTGQVPAEVNVLDDLRHVTDDADVTVEPSSEGLEAVRSGNQIAITGSVPVGETLTVTYTVTIKADGARGDNVASNFLLSPGDPPPPASECEPENDERPDCTTHQIPEVVYGKSVVASDKPIRDGSTLTYTVTVKNVGATTGAVSRFDNLTGVLDDADVTSVPVVTGATTVTASPVVDGVITIGGTIGAGETATITYVVTVKKQADRGDNHATNFVLEDNTVPPTRCDTDTMVCTDTPLPNITPSKTADPAKGSVVVAGQTITYTLTFANTGEAPGLLSYVDDFSTMIDDAELVAEEPVVSVEAVAAEREGHTFVIGGEIGAGQTVTVTYQATVRPDGERGDGVLGNFLMVPGDDPDPTCEPDDVTCTVHDTPDLHDWKTVEASASPVAAGTKLTYTLHFENRGTGDGVVSKVDNLTHVLDDADVTVEPSSEGLTVSRDRAVISISGRLQPKESATVTYTVTVKADGERGDSIAANFLLPSRPGYPPVPPTEPVCQPTDAQEPDCTVTPIGKLTTSKSVAASSTPVTTGTKLTYTLTFDNQSQARATVNKVDDLTDVLDDTTMTSEPVASEDSLTVARDGSTITVTGALEPGETVTVTYTVTVNAESDRGNNTVDNALLTPGTVDPCEEDAAQCTSTPLPNISSSKSVDPESGTTVAAGDVLTYTLTYRNTGRAAGPFERVDHLVGVLDDAAWTSGPVISDPAVTAVRDGSTLVIAGTLQPDQVVTVTYTVTVLPDADRGDDMLRNVLMEPGEDPECIEGQCTENPVPRIVDWKSADPVSGTPVAAGQEVTYTLHFRNDGKAKGDVAKADVLSGVLDDADMVSEPVASSSALTVSEISDGRFLVSGSLEPGASATVSYTVKVLAYADQGDHVLGNWLTGPDSPPGEDCEPRAGEDADCTIHPIGQIAATKSVDPKSGSAVTQGTVLRYTLTFVNTGAGAAAVDYSDHLGDVLDDATLTTQPSADHDGIEIDLSGDTLAIGGSLGAGERATVTYSVTVMAYERQGNHILDNYLGLGGGDPEPRCLADNPLCTSNPTIAPPPPLAITGGELGMGAAALVILLILGGALLTETARRRRLSLEDSMS